MVDSPSLAADARVWLRIGCLSFGGPAGQIALLHRVAVEELGWIAPSRFAAGLDLCMLLPGPEATQLATYIGWTRQGWRGGVVAGGLFVLPGALVMLALAAIYASWGALAAVAALFSGVQCAVVAIVAQALVRIARHALGSPGALVIAVAAFVALAGFGVPFPLVVAAAGAAGLLLPESAAPPAGPATEEGKRHGSLGAAAVATLLWIVPLAALVFGLGLDRLLSRIALRVAELAVLSFGGAYALLAALAERAVADGWLPAAAMADGLALAETTPGPLILVLEFVAFVTAHRASGGLGFALVAAALTVWTLFLPSFVWIFLAAPHLEGVESSPRLRRALRGVSAAVVGVILHLSVWLAVHVLFGRTFAWKAGPLALLLPRPDSLDLYALLVTVAAAAALLVFRWPLARTLALAGALGLARLLL